MTQKHLKKKQEFDNKLSRNKKYEKEKISSFMDKLYILVEKNENKIHEINILCF